MQDKARCETCNAPGPNLWLCLHSNCLYVGCGESSEDHSSSHTEVIHHLRFSLCKMIPQRFKLSIAMVLHSTCSCNFSFVLQTSRHYLTLNMTTMRIWCYACEAEVFKDGNNPPLRYLFSIFSHRLQTN